MKEIEEGIYEVHARAREQKNNEKENQEDKEMAGKAEKVVVKTLLLFKVGKNHYLWVTRYFLPSAKLFEKSDKSQF